MCPKVLPKTLAIISRSSDITLRDTKNEQLDNYEYTHSGVMIICYNYFI